MSKKGKIIAGIMMVTSGLSLMARCAAIEVKDKKEEEKRIAEINSIIDATELELEFGNIKGITQINAVKNNGEFIVIIEGEFNHKVNGETYWTATYNVDKIDFQNIRDLTDLQEKMIYVCDNVYTQYDPIDVSNSEMELELL